MKKIITLIVAGVLIFSLEACSQTTTTPDHSTAAVSSVATELKGEAAEQKGEVAEADLAEAASSAPDSEFYEHTDGVLSNGLFSVDMPEDTAGTYVAQINDTMITICEKESCDEGYGGQVFTIHAANQLKVGNTQPAIRKYGELTAEDGTIYDIMVSRPTDVRFGPDMFDSYRKLQDSMEQIIASLKGVGKGVYVSGAGIKGEDLYKDLLQKYVTALSENWSAVRLQEEEMSSVYDLMQKIYGDNVLNQIGYAYTDMTGEGIDELLIGEMSGEDNRNTIYDIYGIENHSPVHLLSGSNENRYYLEGSYLSNEFTGPNGEEYITFHDNDFLLGYSRMNYDSHGLDRYMINWQANPEQPWFIGYYADDTFGWKNITEEEFKERCSRMIDEDFKLEFKPLSGIVFER